MISPRAKGLLDKMNTQLEEKISAEQRSALQASKTFERFQHPNLRQNQNTYEREMQNAKENKRERLDLERAIENFRRSNSRMVLKQRQTVR